MTPCVLLGLDPATRSGWSLWIRGAYHDSGSVEPGREADVVARAVSLARTQDLPLAVVAETWTSHRGKGGKMSDAAFLALGAAWGRFEGPLLGWSHPARFVARVTPQRWRNAVLGGGWGVTRDEWDRRARLLASRWVGTGSTDDDRHDAVCIGWWGTQAPEVEAMMVPPRRKKKSPTK